MLAREILECDDEWYRAAYLAFEILSKPPFNIDKSVLQVFTCEHMFDSLSYENKIFILNLLETKQKNDPFLRFFKNIIETKFIINVDKKKIVPVIILAPQRIEKTMLTLSKDKWKKITVKNHLKKDYGTPIKTKFIKKNLATIIGFMGINKNNQIIFKVMDMTKISKRNKKGFQCITQQKNKTLILLNQLMKDAPIKRWNKIKFVMNQKTRDDNTIIIERGFSRAQLCVMEEMILRYFNYEDKQKSWFLSFFGTYYNKIEKK